jgi:HK97 family phage major capsid protein
MSELLLKRIDEAKSTAVAASRAVRDLQQQLRGRTDADRREEHRQNFVRHCLIRLVADRPADFASTAVERYPRLVHRAVAGPAMTTVPGWAQELVSDDVVGFMLSGRAPSLLARLAELAFTVSGPAKVPVAGNETNGGWVGEAMGIPVIRAALSSLPITPKKMAAISVFTAEVRKRSTPEIEQIVDALMRQSINKIVDAALVDAAPASATRPAGIRNGVAAIPAGSSMVADLQALAGAVLNAGGESIAYLTNPQQSLAVSLSGGSLADTPILASPAVPAGTVIAVDVLSFAAMIGAAQILPSDETTLALVDDPSADLMANSPVASVLQQDMTALRCLLDAAWGIAGGRIAWTESVTW